MVRRMVAVVILICALGATPALGSTISLGVASPVNAGGTFDVVVQASDVFAGRALDDVLVAFGFNVTIGDPGLFQFVSATVGPLFSPLALGVPMVAGFALNPLGIAPGDFSGPLTLATLHFNALHTGGSSIGVMWDSSDLNQGLVYLDLPFGPISASTDVRAVAAVPEPSTMVLVLAPAIAALRRARSATCAAGCLPRSTSWRGQWETAPRRSGRRSSTACRTSP